jgi:hypothetical protein
MCLRIQFCIHCRFVMLNCVKKVKIKLTRAEVTTCPPTHFQCPFLSDEDLSRFFYLYFTNTVTSNNNLHINSHQTLKIATHSRKKFFSWHGSIPCRDLSRNTYSMRPIQINLKPFIFIMVATSDTLIRELKNFN